MILGASRGSVGWCWLMLVDTSYTMVSTLENPRAFSAPRTVGIRHCTVMNFAVIWHKDRLGLVGYRPRPFLTLVSAIDHWIWWRLEYLDDPLVAQSNIQMKLFYWCMICYIYIYIILYHIYIYILYYMHIDTNIYIYIYVWHNLELLPHPIRPKASRAESTAGTAGVWPSSAVASMEKIWMVPRCWALNCGHHLGNKPWWHNIDMTLI